MSAPAKRGLPVTAAARLGLTVGEVKTLGFLAFLTASHESNPLENLESLADVWRGLVAEISPPPTPRPST